MKKYAFVNNAGELKITINEGTAKMYPHEETELEMYTGNDAAGGRGRKNPDGSYDAAMLTGNPVWEGKEVFVDADGVRVDNAAAKEKPMTEFPLIAETYNRLKG